MSRKIDSIRCVGCGITVKEFSELPESGRKWRCPADNPAYSIKICANLLGYGRALICRHVEKGYLKSEILHGQVVIRVKDLYDWWEDRHFSKGGFAKKGH
jgi:hypothetical protein